MGNGDETAGLKGRGKQGPQTEFVLGPHVERDATAEINIAARELTGFLTSDYMLYRYRSLLMIKGGKHGRR